MNGQITDDTRIRAASTIEYLANHSAKVILAAHFGRQGSGKWKNEINSSSIKIKWIVGENVATNCIGDEAVAQSNGLSNGDVLLLEMFVLVKNDLEFAKKLASHADMYVNDAAGTAHRASIGCYKLFSPQ